MSGKKLEATRSSNLIKNRRQQATINCLRLIRQIWPYKFTQWIFSAVSEQTIKPRPVPSPIFEKHQAEDYEMQPIHFDCRGIAHALITAQLNRISAVQLPSTPKNGKNIDCNFMQTQLSRPFQLRLAAWLQHRESVSLFPLLSFQFLARGSDLQHRLCCGFFTWLYFVLPSRLQIFFLFVFLSWLNSARHTQLLASVSSLVFRRYFGEIVFVAMILFPSDIGSVFGLRQCNLCLVIILEKVFQAQANHFTNVARCLVGPRGSATA